MASRFSSLYAAIVLGTIVMAGMVQAVRAEPISTENALRTTAPSNVQAAQDVQAALATFRKGDVEGALKQLQAAVQKHPDLPPAQIILANWFASAGQPTMVRNALQDAVKESPNDPEAYVLLADMAIRNQMVTEAGLLYEKAMELAKAAKDSTPRIATLRKRSLGGLAGVAEARQDWKSAQANLEALLTEEPKDAGAVQQLGRVLFHQKKPDEALEKFRQAAKLNENLLSAEATLSQLYQQANDTQNAGKWLLEAIKVQPRDFKTRLVAAQWSYEIGKYAQAEEQAKAAVQLDPNSLNAKVVRGLIALVRKDYKTAEEYFEKAHLQSPSSLLPTNGLALALCSQDDPSKKQLALEYAQLNARQFPDQPEASATLGWALYRAGRLNEAENNLRRAFTAAPERTDPNTIFYYARILADRGQKDDARKLLELPPMKSGTTYVMQEKAQKLREELGK